jgi:predicted lysophospholipase L1 biosynthesis ABC-type transport system permease subunit
MAAALLAAVLASLALVAAGLRQRQTAKQAYQPLGAAEGLDAATPAPR